MTAFDSVAFDSVAFDADLPVGWVDLGQNSTIAAVSTADGRKIAALTEWQGRIYLGYGDYDQNQPNAVSVLSWNTATGAYATSLGTFSSNVIDIGRVIDDELWFPSIDMSSGTHGHYAVVTGSHAYTQVTPGSSISAWHLFDCIYFNGQPMIAGSSYESGGACDHGAVWRYNGSAWSKVVDITPATCGVFSPGFRIYGMFTIGSTLYAKPYSSSAVRYTTDGSSWSTGSGLSTSILWRAVEVNGGAVYRTDEFPPANPTALKHYDGSTETTLVASGVVDHCLGPDDLLYYLTGTSIYVSDDDAGDSFTELLDDAPADASSLCVTADAIYVGTEDSHLWRIYT